MTYKMVILIIKHIELIKFWGKHLKFSVTSDDIVNYDTQKNIKILEQIFIFI